LSVVLYDLRATTVAASVGTRYVSDPPFPYDVAKRVPDVTKARRLLGCQATTTLGAMLDEVIPWISQAVADGRLFLEELAGAAGPAEFAERSANNRFDPIDVFVLRDDGDELVVQFDDDAFPAGTRIATVRFPRSLFAEFELARIGPHVLAVRR
jgi:hypothetical protein